MRRCGAVVCATTAGASVASTTTSTLAPQTSSTTSTTSLTRLPSCATTALYTSARWRFYRPIVNTGLPQWRAHMGQTHRGWNLWEYRHERPDPRPLPEPAVNNYHGRTRVWNPIAGKIGLVNRKADEWNWPHARPPPTGLRRSREYIAFFLERYFPDVEVTLVLDSVLNNETDTVVFHVPQDMSRRELVNYLRNVYGIDNVIRVGVRNFRGRQYKNEVGTIKSLPDYKLAVVTLDAPVVVEFKQIKGTEDTPDQRQRSRVE